MMNGNKMVAHSIAQYYNQVMTEEDDKYLRIEPWNVGLFTFEVRDILFRSYDLYYFMIGGMSYLRPVKVPSKCLT